jgi:pyruvate kinase
MRQILRIITLKDQAELERAAQAEFDGLAAGFVTRGDRLGRLRRLQGD